MRFIFIHNHIPLSSIKYVVVIDGTSTSVEGGVQYVPASIVPASIVPASIVPASTCLPL